MSHASSLAIAVHRADQPGVPGGEGEHQIRVGTASWTDKTLIACGRFYPPGASTPEARLRHYAAQFPIVEVDSSYYAMPAPATSQLWAERTPEGFVMNVKAFRLFTGHQTEPKVLHADLRDALGGWMSGKVFDLTGSYHAAFLNGLAWNALNIGIALFLLGRSRGWMRPRLQPSS